MPTVAEWIAQNKSQMGMGAIPSIAASQQSVARQRQNASGMGAFGQAAANRFLGNIANVPDVVGNLAARTVNQAADALPDFMRPENYAQAGGDVRQFQQREPLIPVPALGQEFVPGPTANDLMGLVQRGGELAAATTTGNFSQFRPDAAGQQEARTAQLAEDFPTASALGTISGDMLTLLTARAPMAGTRARSNLAADLIAKRAPVGAKPIELAPSIKEALRLSTSKSKGVARLMNMAGRSAETGLEGFTLAALNGQADPVETLAYAAGTQAAGSLLLSGMKGMLSGGPTRAGLKLAASAAAIGGITQVLKAGTPGGNDSILESMGTGFDKVALGLAAGVVSGAAGMGRVTSGFPVKALPEIADMITSMPRAATMSILTDVLNDPAAEAVVNKLSSNPQYFSPQEQRRLERAFLNADVSLSGTIEELMRDREFQKKFEAIGQ